jgi:hypothetical protein
LAGAFTAAFFAGAFITGFGAGSGLTASSALEFPLGKTALRRNPTTYPKGQLSQRSGLG